ncbi:hypothetical protein [Kitasatospora fiedleri]|uniref:hypothetical protein n=1 Tax=Kitasatospora fiedleri TaxID=2991545 RepID=UPI00249C71B4|nr:hypothetical protein [Kitasatospora fiedleri]
MPGEAIGGLAANNGQAHLTGSRTTIVGLRLDTTSIRASNIDLDATPLTTTALDTLLAVASTGAPQLAATLLSLPATSPAELTTGTAR